MSMNLHCNLLNLWQTPTQITYMCIVDEDGNIDINNQLTGKKAKRALHCYRQWVKNSTNGRWESKEALDSVISDVKEHIKEIDSVINNPDLKVYFL